MSQLENLKDALAKEAHGISRQEAQHQYICIRCKKTPKFYSEEGRREYIISNMCEFCFDIVMTHPDDCCAVCELPIEFHTKMLPAIFKHYFKNKPEEMREGE